MKNLLLYFNTAKYLKKKQIFYRLKKLILPKRFSEFDKLIKEENYFLLEKIPLKFDINLLKQMFDLDEYKKLAKLIMKNRFSFLNREKKYSGKIKWNDLEESRLWRFNLNYFDFTPILGLSFRETKNKKYYSKFVKLASDWIINNKNLSMDAWHPYPTSRRIVNWLLAFYLFYPEIIKENSFYSYYLKLLYFQLDYLSNNLEYDLMNNHLISNAKALLFGGIFFREEKWYKKGIRILEEQLKEQILPDGGHFERSPMYHCIVLTDILDCLCILPQSSDIFKILKEKAEKMLYFLDSILLPDGEIPLFSDSSRDGTLLPGQIFHYSEELGLKRKNKKRIHEFKDSGYYIIKDNISYIIIDGGDIGVYYQPGHGHCDIFSYEFFLGKEKIIVDSGNYEYKIGEMRNYCRSTRAHNTIMINNKEQSEIWGSFRIARRANPKNISLIKKDKLTIFSGNYSPATQPNLIHQRFIISFKDNFWIFFDKVTSKSKNAKKKIIENFIHLHPEIKIKELDKNKFILKSKEHIITLIPFNSYATIGKGWYCPEFGMKIRNSVISLITEEITPIHLGYILIPNIVKSGSIEFNFQKGAKFQIKIDKKQYTLKINIK